MRSSVLVALALVVTWSAACGGDVVVDGPPGGTSGSGSSTSSGGTTGTGSSECVLGECGDACTRCQDGECEDGKCDESGACVVQNEPSCI